MRWLLAALLAIAVAACGSSTGSAAPTGAPGSQDVFGGQVAAALVKKLHADPFIAHIEQVAKATSTLNGTTVNLDATLKVDISGTNTALTMMLAGGGQNLQMDMVLLDDEAFYREDSGAWAPVEISLVQSSFDGFFDTVRFIDDPTDLAYKGVESVDGRDLHRLIAITEIPYVPAAGGTGRYDRFDIWVEADGTPVLIKSAFSATGSNGESVAGETDFTFSKFGGPIEIVAPTLGP